MQSETHMLEDLRIRMLDIDEGLFLRSFGAYRFNSRANSALPYNEAGYVKADKAFSFNSFDNLFVPEKETRKPRCCFKRLLYNNVNCRFDIGVQLTMSNLDSLWEDSLDTLLDVNQRLLYEEILKIHSYKSSPRLREFGKFLPSLYLYATTKKPKVNVSTKLRQLVKPGNLMTIIECHEQELPKDALQKWREFSTHKSEDCEEITVPELKDWGLSLFHLQNAILNSPQAKVWIILKKSGYRKDKLRNLRIYLLKIHEDRECFKRVLKFLGNEDINQVLLQDYLEKSLKVFNKQWWYGVNNRQLIKTLGDIDLFINNSEREEIISCYSDLENRNKITRGVDRLLEKDKIFIVHGHDDKTKLELKNYIQNNLKLGEPVILAEQPSKGMTIIEKFEEYSQNVRYVFILLTPDDTYDGSERARQNVILELGFFLGALGRKSGRIILLYKGVLDIPSDLSGVIYIKIDGGINAAGEEIRKELYL